MDNNILCLIVCSLFDRVSGIYSAPMTFQNIDCAKRFMNEKFYNNISASDYELYSLGFFNIETGEVILESSKNFICRGVYNEQK